MKKLFFSFISVVLLLALFTLAYSQDSYEFVLKWGGQGTGDSQFSGPMGIAVNSEGNVYVADYYNHRIQKFDSDGNFITKWGSYGTADSHFQSPLGIAVDSEGNVYVADRNNNRIQKFAPPYIEVTIDIKPGSYPNSINLGSHGNVPVAILGSADFDATSIDPLSVALAGAGVKMKGKGTPMYSFDDVNGDGIMDMIVHVETEALELTTYDEDAVLEGMTYDGKRIKGVDSVRIVPE